MARTRLKTPKEGGHCKFGDKCGYRHTGKKATPVNSEESSGGDSEKKKKKQKHKQKQKKEKEEAPKKKKKKNDSSSGSANSAVEESSDSDEPESAHPTFVRSDSLESLVLGGAVKSSSNKDSSSDSES